MEAPEEWKCHFFHSANKRCRRSEDCTFAHDQDHPTGWEEARKKNLRRPQEEAVRNFGDQCVESPGILKDRTTSIRCWLRGQDVGDVECEASEMHWKMDQSWVQVLFRNTRPVSAAAEEVFCEAATGSRLAVTAQCHGTTVPAGLAILRDGIKATRGGDPRGVYGSRNLEDAARSGYNIGCVVSSRPGSVEAAAATSGSVVWAGAEIEEVRRLQLVQRGSAGATYEFGRADDSGEPELTLVASAASSSSRFVEIDD